MPVPKPGQSSVPTAAPTAPLPSVSGSRMNPRWLSRIVRPCGSLVRVQPTSTRLNTNQPTTAARR